MRGICWRVLESAVKNINIGKEKERGGKYGLGLIPGAPVSIKEEKQDFFSDCHKTSVKKFIVFILNIGFLENCQVFRRYIIE